jgi:DnaK suppressor protein
MLQFALATRAGDLNAAGRERPEGESRIEDAISQRSALEDAGREATDWREMELDRADRSAVELQSIGAAMERIRAETYGVCLDCGRTIPFRRLLAEPTALRCVGCQTQLERAAQPI